MSDGSWSQWHLPAGQMQRREPVQHCDARHDLHESDVFRGDGNGLGNVRCQRQLPSSCERAVQPVPVRYIDLQEAVRSGYRLRERLLLLRRHVPCAEEPRRQPVRARCRMSIRPFVFARGHLLQFTLQRRVPGVQFVGDVRSGAGESAAASGTWHVHGRWNLAVWWVL